GSFKEMAHIVLLTTNTPLLHSRAQQQQPRNGTESVPSNVGRCYVLSTLSPSSYCIVNLPLLKTLTLDDVGFEAAEDFMKLISGCPKLEELKTSSVRAKDGFQVGDYLKPLSTLIKADITLFEIPYKAVYNVKSLTVSGV
ncbi:F-box/LRR-repeat protein, partial [Trifolium medium]|nr:F-box/LRR-repeat protein [Trifolium medium]